MLPLPRLLSNRFTAEIGLNQIFFSLLCSSFTSPSSTTLLLSFETPDSVEHMSSRPLSTADVGILLYRIILRNALEAAIVERSDLRTSLFVRRLLCLMPRPFRRSPID